MTDIEKFVDLYGSFEVKLEPEVVDFGNEFIVTLGADVNKAFKESYNGFYSCVRFDKSGKFIAQSFLE